MVSPEYPSDRFHADLLNAIQSSRLTATGLGRLWSAENDVDPRTNEQRVRRLMRKLPIQVTEIVSLLDALGYDVEIKKR